MKVTYHSEALSELSEIASYYERQLPNLGSDFLGELNQVVSIVAENPQIGAIFHHHFRRVLLHRFPFSVFYLIEGDVVRIMAVAHQRRWPGYWNDRR